MNSRSTDCTDWAYRLKSGDAFWAVHETYIDNTGESSDSVWSINNVEIRLHILHDRRSDHYYIFCDGRKLLDHKVDHLSQGGLSKRIRNLLPLPNKSLTSLCWNSFVTPKNNVVASWVEKVSPT